MRLICPNCAAQYEVAEDAIPESGRDVQCANCGDTWFQEHPAASFSQVATEDDTDAPEDVTPGFEAGADSDLTDEADHRPDAIFDRVDDDLDDPDAAEAMSPQPAFAQTKTDPSVLDILRSEALREASARDAEITGAESSETATTRAAESSQKAADTATKRRIHFTPDAATDDDSHAAGYKGTEDDDPDGDDDLEQVEDLRVLPIPPRQARQESAARTLPDINELNSSLRSSHDKARGQDGTPAAKARARNHNNVKSREGFYLAVVLALLLVILYVLAAKIGTSMPAAQPYLDSYVNLIDSLRRGLADGFSGLMKVVKGLLAKIL